MRNLLKLAPSAAAAVLVLFGCSDPKEANETNFKKAIQAALASNQVCENLLGGMSETDGGFRVTHYGPIPLLTVAERAGVIALRDAPLAGAASGGHDYHIKVLRPDLWDDKRGLCYGTMRVDKVLRWTEPADMMGRIMSIAVYRWNLAPAKWTTADALEKAGIKIQGEDRAGLIKMNAGWEVSRNGS